MSSNLRPNCTFCFEFSCFFVYSKIMITVIQSYAIDLAINVLIFSNLIIGLD